MSDLRERVARAIFESGEDKQYHISWTTLEETAKDLFRNEADVAIALVLEQAAKVAETCHVGWPMDGREQRNVCAAAIRALGKP